MTQTATKTQKQVKVLARVQYKNNLHIIAYFVLSSDGVTIYKTIFSHGKLAGCTCPAGHKYCYHGKQLTEIENTHKVEQVPTPALAPAVETFPLVAVLAEAQAAMVLFDRQVKSGLAAADAYEVIAAMRKAVQSVPSFIERPQGVGCEFCGKNHSSANCPF